MILLDLAYVYFRADQKAKAQSCVQSFKQQWPNMKLAQFYEKMLVIDQPKVAPDLQGKQNSSAGKQQKEDPLDNNPKDSGF